MRKRRTKKEMEAAKAASSKTNTKTSIAPKIDNKQINLIPQTQINSGFKLKIFDHSELKTLKAETYGFSVEVSDGDKIVTVEFDTYLKKIRFKVDSGAGYPYDYQFTTTQLSTFLQKMGKMEKRDGTG